MINQISHINVFSKQPKQAVHTVIVSKDLWLGECLGDYLFKLCGTDEVIWIPKETIRHAAFNAHAFEVSIHEEDTFSCAKLSISNCIRMWLVDHHQIKGKLALPFLKRSR